VGSGADPAQEGEVKSDDKITIANTSPAGGVFTRMTNRSKILFLRLSFVFFSYFCTVN
jgi:hypothetical protein